MTCPGYSRCLGRGSVIAMDFWQHLAGQAPYDRLRRTAVRSLRVIGEPITFEQPAGDVAAVLAPAGFDVLDLAGAPRNDGAVRLGRPALRRGDVHSGRDPALSSAGVERRSSLR